MTTEERRETIRFVEANALGETGKYRYSKHGTKATLYSSAYAVMTLHLLDSLDGMDLEEWQKFLQSYQDDDGIFRDPVIMDKGWYTTDSFSCGTPHQTCHALIAMSCLGGVAKKELRFVNDWKDIDKLVKWLAGRSWETKFDCVCNEIMNLTNMLQYSRDFHNDEAAGRAVTVILDWLSENYISSETGLWGSLDLSDPKSLSVAVQAAYHWWELYFYDNRPIPYQEKTLEYILRTQNPLGGFGWGVHNPWDPWQSSACEDIDSLVPLCRFWLEGTTRDERVEAAIRKGRKRVAENRVADGGMVFIKGRDYEYGHPQFFNKKEDGALFPTWFRTLTLAFCDTALGEGDGLQFIHCPGYQFLK